MDEHHHTHHSGHGTFLSYALGFAISIALTLVAFAFVIWRPLTNPLTILSIVILAIAQLVVQLFFFLHLGRESKPRWNLSVFYFALLVVLILVVGSLWIMNNLNYNMNATSPQQMDAYMQSQ